MISTRKNIRICQVYYESDYHDLILGINNLDEVDDIITNWALDKFGVVSGTETVLLTPLNLPDALMYNKNLGEVLTSIETDNFVYTVSGT